MEQGVQEVWRGTKGGHLPGQDNVRLLNPVLLKLDPDRSNSAFKATKCDSSDAHLRCKSCHRLHVAPDKTVDFPSREDDERLCPWANPYQ